MENEKKKNKIIRIKPIDEFSKFEDAFEDPQAESEVDTLVNDEQFKKRFVSGIMNTIKKEKRFTNNWEPIDINRGKTQREKWEEEKRRREELSAVDDLPDNVIPFRRKLK